MCTLYVFLSVSMANNNFILALNKMLENKLETHDIAFEKQILWWTKLNFLLLMVICFVLNTDEHMRFECRHNMLQIVLLRPHPPHQYIHTHVQTMAEFASVSLCYDKTVNKWNYCLRRQYNQCPTLIIIIYNITEHVFFHTEANCGTEVLVAHTSTLSIWSAPSSSPSYAIIARFMKKNNGKRNQLNRWSIDLRWIYMAA